MEGEGFVWRTDESAIRDAQEALDKAELDKQISDLEDAKEKLEDMLEQEEEALDKNIEKLQEYKDKWGEIADAYQDEQDRDVYKRQVRENLQTLLLPEFEKRLQIELANLVILTRCFDSIK